MHLAKQIHEMSDTEKAHAIMAANKKHLITAREAGLLLSCSEKTIYKFMQRGFIKEGIIATRPLGYGRRIFILREELLKLITEPLRKNKENKAL